MTSEKKGFVYYNLIGDYNFVSIIFAKDKNELNCDGVTRQVLDMPQNFDLDYYIVYSITRGENVRGGSYNTIILSDWQKEEIMRLGPDVTEGCCYCGAFEHFSKKCPRIVGKSVSEKVALALGIHVDDLHYISKKLLNDAMTRAHITIKDRATFELNCRILE